MTYLIGAQGVVPVVTLGNLSGVPSRVLLFREHIDWGIVRWFLAGAIPGGLAGAWLFTQTKAEWLQLLIAIFLLTAPLQYRLGEREKSFEVRLWWFLPAGLLVAFFSGLIGGTGPVLNPLYLIYGTREGGDDRYEVAQAVRHASDQTRRAARSACTRERWTSASRRACGSGAG